MAQAFVHPAGIEQHPFAHGAPSYKIGIPLRITAEKFDDYVRSMVNRARMCAVESVPYCCLARFETPELARSWATLWAQWGFRCEVLLDECAHTEASVEMLAQILERFPPRDAKIYTIAYQMPQFG